MWTSVRLTHADMMEFATTCPIDSHVHVLVDTAASFVKQVWKKMSKSHRTTESNTLQGYVSPVMDSVKGY